MRAEHFSVPAGLLFKSPELRLDAGYYNPRAAIALDRLRRSGMEIKPLGDLTEDVFIPPRFARTYVDRDHGLPFLQGSHIIQLQPADLKFVSRKVHKNIDRWVIRDGWILVTRSGSVGRVAIAPPNWDGWAASEHILRVIPRDDGECPAGYLYAFLTSSVGQAQLTAHIYGAVVDELTEDHVKGVLVPVPKDKKQHREVEEIDQAARRAVARRSEAVSLSEDAVSRAEALVGASDTSEEMDAFTDLAQKLVSVPKHEVESKKKAKK